MRFFFAVISAALAIAALCGLAAVWDGSYYLFRTLDDRVSYVTHQRVLDFALSAPALIASNFTGDLSIVRFVFSLSYALVPFVSLLACWLIVRKEAPGLFVWPALGIAIGTLPGALALTTEANQAVEFFWPVLLSLLIGVPRSTLWLTAAMTVLCFFTHPTSAALLGFGALVAAYLAYRRRDDSLMLAAWAQGLILLAFARYLFIRPDSYEQGEVSLNTVTDSFKQAVEGTPLWALLSALVAGILIVAATRGQQRQSARATTAMRFYAAACTVVAGLLLIYWTQDVASWGNELAFKGIVMVVSVPFMLLAILDADFGTNLLRGHFDNQDVRFRTGIAQAAGVFFLAVLSMQGLQFSGLTDRLRHDLATSKTACLSVTSLPYLQNTGLNHWGLSSLAIVEQSQTPRTVMLMNDGCAQALRTGKVQIISWDAASTSTTWFDMSVVHKRLAAERAAAAKTP